MHILFLSHYFPPEVNAPASRTYENARRWVDAGHRVTVITGVPNHPGGIVYPGYANRPWQWERIDGIRVLRIMTFLASNKGVLRRTLNYISFMLSAVVMCKKVQKPDVVVSTSPQFFCGLSGFFVSKIRQCPWILEIRDLWPESIIAVGAIRHQWLIRMLKSLERFMYKKADHIIPVTRAFKQYIHACGIPFTGTSIITNGVDLKLFSGQVPARKIRNIYHLEDKFVVSFIGTHGMAHGLETILKAAVALRYNPSVVFMLVGDGARRQHLVNEKERLGLDNVLMIPQQDKSQIPAFISASDACLVLLKNSELFKTVIPSKIFEIMAMKRPIILGVDGESRQIIERGNCGLCIEPENHEELVSVIRQLSENRSLCQQMGRQGRIFVKQHYDRDILAQRYLDVICRFSQAQGYA